MSSSSTSTVLKTLLVSDLVASTKLAEELGDKRSAELFSRHDRLARDLLAAHTGREIDKTDGFLLLFERPIHAVRYALAYHRQLAALAREEGVELSARVGIHVGEVILRRNSPEDVTRGAKPLEVEGLAKPTAARMMSLAGGHQTLMSQAAFELARRGAVDSSPADGEVRWLAHGEYLLKGVEAPVAVFEVGVDGLAPLAPPADTEKAHRVETADTILGWRPGPGLEIPRQPQWLLSRRLGKGRSGETWLAENRKLGTRHVFKFCFDTERLKGLRYEITLCRLLKEKLGDRPDITGILDWSFEQAPYFIEWAYLGDGNLAEWAEQQGGLAAIPLPDRLRIVSQVAEALDAAHSVGVLHKNVGPENVLISPGTGGRSQAQLTDFGVGLLTDPSMIETELFRWRKAESVESSRVEAPIYAAPELLEGHSATIQSDIYALGVILYQMVVGDFSRALAPGWDQDVDDEILREEISACVDRSPGRRLRHAGGLAETLPRLEERRQRRSTQIIEREAAAQAVELAERARRRRRLTAAASVVLLLLAGSMALLARYGLTQAKRANAEARTARQVSDFLVDLFEVSDPDRAADTWPDARDLLARGAEKIATDLEDQPLVRARLQHTVGTIYLKMGLYKEALAFLTPAFETRVRDLGEAHTDSVESLGRLAEAWWRTGDYDAAESLLDRALELGDGDPVRDSENLNLLANVYWRQGRYNDAETAYQRAIALAEAKLGVGDPRVASILNGLAIVYWSQGRFADAEPLWQRTHEIRERTLGPDHPRIADSLNNLGILKNELGKYGESETLFRRALAIKEQALGADHPDVARILSSTAALYKKQERNAEAEALYQRVLGIWDRAFEMSHPAAATSLNSLGDLYERQGRLDQAEVQYQRALTVRETTLDPGHPDVAESLESLARLYATRGKHDLAEAYYRRSRALFEQALGTEHLKTGRSLIGLARLYRDQGRYAESAPLFERGLAIQESALGADHPDVVETRDAQATLLRAMANNR